MPGRIHASALVLALGIGALASSAKAACLEEVEALAAGLAASHDAGALPADGAALTGDPLDPFPDAAEGGAATDEEATGVMPGADPSVALVSEEERAAIAAGLEGAREAAMAGDAAACRAALDAARTRLAR